MECLHDSDDPHAHSFCVECGSVCGKADFLVDDEGFTQVYIECNDCGAVIAL